MDGSSHRLAAVGFQARARAIQKWRREWPVVGKQCTLLGRVGARGRRPGQREWGTPRQCRERTVAQRRPREAGSRHSKVNNASRDAPRQAHLASSAGEDVTQPSVECPCSSLNLAGQPDCSFLCTQGLVSSFRSESKVEDGDDAAAVATAFRCGPYPGFLAKKREEWRTGLGSGASRRCCTARSRDVTLHVHLTPLPLL